MAKKRRLSKKSAKFIKGDLVRHRVWDHCIIKEVKKNGLFLLETRDGEYLEAGASDFKFLHRSFGLKLLSVKEEKAIWRGLNQCGHVRCPKCLRALLTMEEWAFLSFLINYRDLKIKEEGLLEHNRNEFYCPDKTIARAFPNDSPRTFKRLFAQLWDKGFVFTRMRYGFTDGKHCNARMIRINFDKLKQLDAEKRGHWLDYEDEQAEFKERDLYENV